MSSDIVTQSHQSFTPWSRPICLVSPYVSSPTVYFRSHRSFLSAISSPHTLVSRRGQALLSLTSRLPPSPPVLLPHIACLSPPPATTHPAIYIVGAFRRLIWFLFVLDLRRLLAWDLCSRQRECDQHRYWIRVGYDQ